MSVFRTEGRKAGADPERCWPQAGLSIYDWFDRNSMGVPPDACLLLPPKWSPVIVRHPNLSVTSLCLLGLC